MTNIEVHFVGGSRDGDVLILPDHQRALLIPKQIDDGPDYETLILPIRKRTDGTYGVDGTKL